jgi:predicted esterase
MVVMLHGAGRVRGVWERWAAAAQARGYVVCLPLNSIDGAGGAISDRHESGRRWVDADLPKLIALTSQLVQTLQSDKERVFILGQGASGSFATQAALTHPELFSAVVSIAGGCNAVPRSEPAKQVGVYLIHGDDDRVVPVEFARQSAARLRGGGLSHVLLKEHPQRGHEMFEDEIPAVFEWLERPR